MNVNEVEKYCMSFTGAKQKENGEPSNILNFTVADKKFAYFKISEPQKWRFSFRASPSNFLELTDQAGIQPARYMHRFHWVTVVKVNAMDSNYLKHLIEWSYNKAFSSLSKKRQREISFRLL